MNEQELRSALMAEIEAWHAANFPTLYLASENGPMPDEASISSTWLDVSLRWQGGRGLSIGEVTKGRLGALLCVKVFTREGSGIAESDRVMVSLRENIGTPRRIGSAVIQFPQPYTATTALGWHKTGYMFPITLDV